MRYVIIPGIGGSGPSHWQSYWEDELGSAATRIAPSSWDEPDLDDWLAAISAAATPDAVLVAHSLGCLAAATWLVEQGGDAAAAFLVAPPDPASSAFPPAATSFTRTGRPLGVPGLVLASTDDAYSECDTTLLAAEQWQAGFIRLGARGHINTASGLGAWPEGRNLLTAFTAGLAGGAETRGSAGHSDPVRPAGA